VEACARLKGGKLAKEKLKGQLHKIALKRTGGTRTDEILDRDSGPEGLPHSIILTPDGAEGEVPVLPAASQVNGGPPAEAALVEAPAPARTRGRGRVEDAPAPRTRKRGPVSTPPGRSAGRSAGKRAKGTARAARVGRAPKGGRPARAPRRKKR
jgi:DNA topoisomerase-6 subunit B